VASSQNEAGEEVPRFFGDVVDSAAAHSSWICRK
jgi:hypothetical protein